MNDSDKKLGLNIAITRRDVLNGMGAMVAGAIVGGHSVTHAADVAAGNSLAMPVRQPYYPPALMGMRGSHAGSFEVAHQVARYGRKDWGEINSDDDIYDLIVVGAGISGLAAAHFNQKLNPNAKILLIDNHDDFGGHATRNEFTVNGKKLIGYGGAQTLQGPSEYSDIVNTLLDDLGIDIKRFDKAYDQQFYKRNGLRGGIHFNKKDWGVDRIVPFDIGTFEDYLPLKESALTAQQAVDQMPISDAAKVEFVRLLLWEDNQLIAMSPQARRRYLNSISYKDFISKHLDITEAEVFAVLQDLASDSGLGIDACPAGAAINYGGLPGYLAAGYDDEQGEDDEPYIHHFPDGNASVARLLVRKMIPDVAKGHTMEDIVTTQFDYSKLDRAQSLVRIRLNSTVVRVKHIKAKKTTDQVSVTYVSGDRAYRVKGRACVLACYNTMIPHLCPELPEQQRQALSRQVKMPILYSTVAVRNWQPWKKLGIGAVVSPSDYHVHTKLDFPVSLGDYQYSTSPEQPVIIHMERFPHRSNEGLTAHEQFRLGRQELMTTSFKTIERHIRSQLNSMLSAAGFDAARDIVAITVNRWAHGYASWYNPLFEDVYEDWRDERYPHMKARKRFGQITIANSDSAASAMFEDAVEQGYRAISELNR